MTFVSLIFVIPVKTIFFIFVQMIQLKTVLNNLLFKHVAIRFKSITWFLPIPFIKLHFFCWIKFMFKCGCPWDRSENRWLFCISKPAKRKWVTNFSRCYLNPWYLIYNYTAGPKVCTVAEETARSSHELSLFELYKFEILFQFVS